MPENYGENNKFRPDFFGFYTCEVAELLSQDEGLLPFSNQVSHLAGDPYEVNREKYPNRIKENDDICSSAVLNFNGMGAQFSEFKKERLKSLLRQSVFNLTQGVDEMINPVLSICRIRSCLKSKESLLRLDGTAACMADELQHPPKKLKVLSTSSDLEDEDRKVNEPRKELSDDVVEKCNQCSAASDGTEIDDDLRFILESDSTKVEELIKKYSAELSDTLVHMEQKLEELLNTIMASCRTMTPGEKQQLRKSIENLPPQNLDRVVEIIKQSKPSENDLDELHIDLNDEDDATLWRLYFYVKAIQW